MILVYDGLVLATTKNRVSVTLTYATDDQMTEVTRRVLEAIDQHADAGFELSMIMTHQHTEGDDD